MQWIHHYNLFLFDLDGLLVDTERVHYAAYQAMCRERGFDLGWDFTRYCEVAHYTDTGLRDTIFAENPQLRAMEPDWGVLYQEKRSHYLRLLGEAPAPLMADVEELLIELQEAGIRRCVVTHSGRELVNRLREQNPVLNTISHWFTREDYSRAKPDPDGYLTAIRALGGEGDRIIGFEDSPRGLAALKATPALPVLVCPKAHPAIRDLEKLDTLYFPRLGAIQRQEQLQPK